MAKRFNIDKALHNAMRRTLNKLLSKSKTVGGRAVRETYNIKSKDLNKSLRLRRANYTKLEAEIRVRGNLMKVYYFGARATRRGVTVRIRKDRGRKLIASAFIQQMRTGHTGVFLRKGKERLPIREVTTISTAQMFEQAAVDAIQKMIAKDGAEILQRELDFEYSKYK